MTSQAWKPSRGFALLVVATAAFLLFAGANPSRAAAACDNTWIGGTGDWNDTNNWNDVKDAIPSNNVPGSDDDACILSGNARIFDNTVFSSGTAKSITVGDGDTGNGGAMVSIIATTDGVTPRNANLSGTSADSTINTDGTVELTSTGTNPGQAEWLDSGGSINNAGLIHSAPGTGGGRLFGLTLNNLAGGTVDIDRSATQNFTETWTNNGTFDVADGQQFTISGTGGGPTFKQQGGTIQTHSTGTFFQSGGFFEHTGGSTSGTKPISLCGPNLKAPSGGTGAYDFIRDTGCSGGSITGDIGAGHTVRLNNTDTNNPMGVSLTADLANNGSLILTGPAEDQLMGGFKLTNNGTLQTAAGGARTFGIQLDNAASGTFDLDRSACQCFTSTWTNNGTFDIADGQQFTISGTGGGPTFKQQGGTLQTNATGTFFQSGGFFEHTGGSTSGTKPIQLCGPELKAPSGGSGAYDFIQDTTAGCGGGSINGNIGAGHTVRLNNTSNSGMGVSLANAVTNNGSLVMTGTHDENLGSGQALTNNGTFRVEGTGGRLTGNPITNSSTGTMDIDQDLTIGFSTTTTNNGVFDIAAGKTVAINGSGGGPTYNQSGGTVNIAGTLFNDGAYNHSGGTTTVAAGGTLNTNGHTMAMSGGTLQGAGMVNTGGGTVNNTGGTVAPGTSPGVLTITGNYTQGPGGTLAVEINGGTAGTGYDQLSVGGNAALDGEIDITNGIFSPSGQQFQVLTGGGVSGTFATLDVHGGLPNYTPAYHANDVTLVAKGPSAPAVTGTSPASGGNDNSPRVLGTAEAGSTVRVFDSTDCSGTPVAIGTAAEFASPGIAVSVPDNSARTFHVDASNADGRSPCSGSSATYNEVTPPDAPALTATSPGSGANDNSPRILGTAKAGSTVKLYDSADCSGSPVATGTAGDLASPGIAVSVPDNSTTAFRATATDATGTSECSAPISYSEVTPQPPPAAGAVTVGKGPAKKTTKKTATFQFSAANAASFQCSLDGKPFAPCTSPLKLKKLKKGKHTLDIRAIGADGQPGATTHYAWKVKKKKKK